MGLGSKLPCASRDPCFSSVAPKLASTKSGGMAPAMAHRHALAILKSSASYFCKHTYKRDRGSKKRLHLQLRYGVDPVEHSQEEDNGRRQEWRKRCKEVACHKLINDSHLVRFCLSSSAHGNPIDLLPPQLCSTLTIGVRKRKRKLWGTL